MADIFSKQKRTEIMTRVRSKNSKAELLVFAYLRQRRIYFQKHYVKVGGTPDIALPRKKLACFIDGDFWHGRTLDDLIQRHGPESFWAKKISGNIERDARQRKELMEKGWRILVVWESDINRKRTRAKALTSIETFLLSRRR